MDFAHIVGFAVIIGFLVMAPGPSGLLIIRTVPIAGQACGFASIAGFIVAFCLHGSMSIFGVSVLLAKSNLLLSSVKFLGAAYLCWIGFKAIHAAIVEIKDEGRTHSGNHRNSLWISFSDGFFTNALNPKILIFYIAVFPHLIPPGDDAMPLALTLVGLHMGFSTIWFSGLVLLLSSLKAVHFNVPMQRMLNGVAGTVFIAIGVNYSKFLV
ncbi:MAG: LysE family translocator [Alphaproteobacteria bacterium]|nr:LysE family translocator [Alphaproteobacteria bacterium]